jgi:hypothetical protein
VCPCRRIAGADVLWRQLCIQRFNTPPDLNNPDMTWREVYRSVRPTMQSGTTHSHQQDLVFFKCIPGGGGTVVVCLQMVVLSWHDMRMGGIIALSLSQ